MPRSKALDLAKPSSSLPLKKHYVLHFDINETILLGDEAGGDSRSDSVNKIIAKSAFVRIPDGKDPSLDSLSELKPTHWWDGQEIQVVPNEPDAGSPPLYTDWQWPEKCCPYYRTAFKKQAKTFVSHHGSVYKSLLQQIEDNLEPSHAMETHTRKPILLPYIMPSFFKTLVALTEGNVMFTIVFRTMGTDLPEIAKAITEFAKGRHPDFPLFRNEALVLDQHELMKGRWMEDCGEYIYQLQRNGEIVASGDAEVLEFLHSRPICGIQDDYLFWKKNEYMPWAGKPVWIPQDKSFHHILFDDNIHNLKNDSIASVRHQLTDTNFRTLSDVEILEQQGKSLIRVPTVLPILDESWFFDQISTASHPLDGDDDKISS